MVVPRQKYIWVFGAWEGHLYSDNSKHLFEYICNNEQKIRAIWLTHEKNILSDLHILNREVYMINSFLGYWYTCRAGLILVTHSPYDVNPYAISRAKKLMLWHGMPVKKIGWDDDYNEGKANSFKRITKKLWYKIFPFIMVHWDVIISYNSICKKYMQSAFNAMENQVKITGYPRNDIILKSNLPLPIINTLKAKLNADKLILYAPTFRNNPKHNKNLFSTFNGMKFNDFLIKNDAAMIIKMHYAVYNKNNPFLATSENNKPTHIYWLQEKEVQDINELLPNIDILITDYSGIYFDYLLLDRPTIFAPFDIEVYNRDEREFYEDYNQVSIGGPKCYNWIEIIEACQDIFNNEDIYVRKRKIAFKKYHNFVDANNCFRVTTIAKDLMQLI
jgi:CDP-glycerol glycerophosphotransferase (TagB/SpsB family)